jgi:RimJ/RimL family protein N-acetyltransferase
MDRPDIPTLETPRLRLRELRGSDFEDYAALYADPDRAAYLREVAPGAALARRAG